MYVNMLVTQPSNRQFGLWALQTFSVVGRARHPEGVLLTFLDNKLRDQEEKNNYKETLMYKALAEIKGRARMSMLSNFTYIS